MAFIQRSAQGALRVPQRVLAVVAAALIAGLATPAAPSSGAAVGPHTAVGQAPTWVVVPSPNRKINGHGHDDEVYDISCPSASSCTAVGYSNLLGNRQETLVETWNGTAASIVPSPNNGKLSHNTLDGVSCISASACTAVGFSYNAQPEYRTLIETGNGTSWARVPSPNPSAGYDVLSSVSCVSAVFCAAVGYHGRSPAGSKALIEIWNGTKWSVVSSPNAGSDNSLSGVSCVSASSCTAVGSRASGGTTVEQTLVESWNGSTWSIVPSPAPGPGSYLNGVSCLSATACTAVGSYFSSPVFQNLIESWNGTTWSVVPSPDLGGSQVEQDLDGVSCASASACTAVGSRTLMGTLILAWDGTTWSIVPAPRISGGRPVALLYDVSCPTPTMCMAAGVRNAADTVGGDRTLLEQGTSSG